MEVTRPIPAALACDREDCMSVGALRVLATPPKTTLTVTSFVGEPIDAELRDAALAAARDAGRVARERLGQSGWLPRVRLPVVTKFDSGWPDIRPGFSSNDDDPVDFAAMFARKPGPLNPLPYDAAPALVAFIEYVAARSDLCERLTYPHPRTGEPVVALTEHEAASLPLSLAARADALGDRSDETLQELYLLREQDWLAPELLVEYVVPLALTALELNEPLQLDAVTTLTPLGDKEHAARPPDLFGGLSSVPQPVLTAATHAIVLKDHRILNPGPLRRLFGRDQQLSLPLDDADLVCQALRVLTHLPVGYAQVLRRPVGWANRWTHDLPELDQVAVLRRYPDRHDDYGWLRTRPDSPRTPRSVLDRLPEILAALRAATPRTTLAARRLTAAELRDDPDDRTVDACIGLEALLGEGRDELTHRLSLRAATALSTRPGRPANATEVYDLVKKVYGRRSAVVHGTATDRHRTLRAPDGSQWDTDTAACVLLRELLEDQLTRTGGWTPHTLDALLLERLGTGIDAATDDKGGS
jgi:hypothetical protein